MPDARENGWATSHWTVGESPLAQQGTKNMPANHKTRYTVALTVGTYKFRCDFHNNMKGTITVP